MDFCSQEDLIVSINSLVKDYLGRVLVFLGKMRNSTLLRDLVAFSLQCSSFSFTDTYRFQHLLVGQTPSYDV